MSRAAKTVFSCTACGRNEPRWLGQCPGCGAWSTLIEERVTNDDARATGQRRRSAPRSVVALSEVALEDSDRLKTGIPELDRVLGGGLVPGSLVLLGGEPGVGKSTLLLSALAAISRARRALLVTGEESVAQVKLRAERLGGAEAVEILTETELDAVC